MLAAVFIKRRGIRKRDEKNILRSFDFLKRDSKGLIENQIKYQIFRLR